MEIKKKLIFLTLIPLIITLLLFSYVSALTASSNSYSVTTFGTGMATGNSNSGSYDATFLSGTGGTTRNAESNSLTANIGFFENTVYSRTVSITSYSISPSSATVGSTIGLYISALNYESVWAKITSPNAQEQTLNLINGATVNFVPNPSVVGTYTVVFYANSSTGAIASVVGHFTFTEQTAPPAQLPSVGGGTTTIIEQCSYVWDCTPWSVCAEGLQKRECKNIGTCLGEENKPTEEILCTDALFDIFLKLNDIELTEDKNLNFIVSLTEQFGVEKIDVHIKHSIINNEGYEIFSQIETRAIQENLTFEKEINEIKLVDGKYILRVDILYGNLQRAFAEQSFRIVDGKIELEESTLDTSRISGFATKGLEVVGKYKVILIIVALVVLALLIGIFFYINKKKSAIERKTHTREGYRNKVRGNLRKIRGKHLLMVLAGFMLIGFLSINGSRITGFVIGGTNATTDYWSILEIILIGGLLGLLILGYKKRIFEKIDLVKRNKHPKDSLEGLIKKEVYCAEGNYIGKVEGVLLGKNKIDGLEVEIDKKHKFEHRGIVINYNSVKSIGNIVVVEGNILEKLKS